MDESYANLQTSHLLGSVPAVVSEDRKSTSYEAPVANLQAFPPNSAGGGRGYQTLRSPIEEIELQPANNWNGVFSISSYTQYFNVDTDIVLNRLMSSLYPINGDFFSKIDSNPDLYGLVWISATLMFVIASLGNFSTYLMDKRSDSSTSWSFDVNYVNVAACAIYGYIVIVPLAFYFLLQYLGSKPSLISFWCMWGYSLSIFVLSSVLLIIPVEFIRWTVIIITGAASASFVTLNLKSYVAGDDLTVVLIAAFILQLGLAIFIKMWFFA
ncbi:hypothetical protein RHGRI_027525 [Rhododendron griersonianum]|uniref:Protein YIP n=1 Tax=Rhododendron griersonianum TaxID=479676 RepID=A0AAV6IZL4_9ERIC|nr:hypothetical protein RHGRI_027525 [Rhododendron griersonianum]